MNISQYLQVFQRKYQSFAEFQGHFNLKFSMLYIGSGTIT